jgi:branched-chain amino acid transport system permease protein
VAGAMVAWLMGLFLFLGRRRDDEFFVAMALLGFTFISERVATSWAAIGSANGIPSIPLMTTDLGPVSFGELAPGLGFYFLVAGCLTVAYVLVRFAVRSQFGLVLVAARQDDSRASFLGYPTARFRLLAYTASGAIAGVAGGLYAFHEGFVSPSLLGVALSTQALLWVLLGGRGILIGAVVGALLLNYISFELSGFLSTAWQIVLGLIVVVGATVLPRGVLSPILPREAFVFGRRAATLVQPDGGDAVEASRSMA